MILTVFKKKHMPYMHRKKIGKKHTKMPLLDFLESGIMCNFYFLIYIDISYKCSTIYISTKFSVIIIKF